MPTSGAATTPDTPQGGAAAAARAAAASASIPTGDLPGWHQIFSDDFTTPVASGAWGTSAYSKRWLSYDGFADTHGVGRYSTSTLSVSDGNLDMHWSTQNGVPLVSGLVPLVNGKWGGQVGGRYSVRFRADPTPGYTSVMLLWPDSNNWGQGEVDFSEGSLDGVINAYEHCTGSDPSKNCGLATTTSSWNDWHVATVEWTSTGVDYFLDGVKILTSTDVPTDPLHMVMQGFAHPGVAPSAATTVQVDWVSIWAPTASSAS